MNPLDKIARFQTLHESGCFVMPNAWDRGSTVYLTQLGFSALGTTSAGFAFSAGQPDSSVAVPRDAVLQHVRELVSATDLPVSADFQSGHAADLEALATNVRACLDAGVAGLSIEDLSGDPRQPLYPARTALERIRTARAAIDASGRRAVLTARCEAFLIGHASPLSEAAERLAAFAEAGADCLYAPGVQRLADVDVLVRAVAPRPLNVLVGAPLPDFSVDRLAEHGVRRISLGSALARAAWGAFIAAARELMQHGTFGALAGATPHQELHDLFGATGIRDPISMFARTR